ncbi:MAG: universal stress protein [Deltaproteobacteria bacterium]|nr:universal stress protein [Deltaproteobacteria bacterium]MCW5803609.1 universal stress protein [Deltaproteobacteria bacterium]
MPFKKILCATDFSPGAQQATKLAGRLTDEVPGREGELVLVHAWHVPTPAYAGEILIPPMTIDTLTRDAELGLKSAADEASRSGRRVSYKLLTGPPWGAIVDAADKDPAIDLIVVGTHGRTGLSRVLLGSVAEKVVRHAPCSVLVVRPEGEPPRFQHVFVPTDYSEEARHATELAAELVVPGGEGITLFHVLELPVALTGEALVPDVYRDLGDVSAKSLDAAAADLRARIDAPVTTRQRIGRPGSETLAALESDRTVDLVVMGSHGRTGLQRMLLGSVAEKVVRHARCPVLVTRRRA